MPPGFEDWCLDSTRTDWCEKSLAGCRVQGAGCRVQGAFLALAKKALGEARASMAAPGALVLERIPFFMFTVENA